MKTFTKIMGFNQTEAVVNFRFRQRWAVFCVEWTIF
jgi:hypothetical protein